MYESENGFHGSFIHYILTPQKQDIIFSIHACEDVVMRLSAQTVITSYQFVVISNLIDVSAFPLIFGKSVYKLRSDMVKYYVKFFFLIMVYCHSIELEIVRYIRI